MDMDHITFLADMLAIGLAIYGLIVLVCWYFFMRRFYAMEFKEYAALIRYAVKLTLLRVNIISIINWTVTIGLYGVLIYHDRYWSISIGVVMTVLLALVYMAGKEKEREIV
jgi:hypothetical protein